MNTLSITLTNRRHFLNLTTDLQRVVFSIINNNHDSALVFIAHAQKIYTDNIKNCTEKEIIFDSDLDIIWEKICVDKLPDNNEELNRFADKVLTICCIIFNRTLCCKIIS